MVKVRISVVRITEHRDLSERYELPQRAPCLMREGMSFVVEDLETKPQGLCDSAWQTLFPFVLTLSCGGSRIYGDWMKDPRSALISCNDGFRPVSFLLEAID